jgi:uncharacterized protein with GYD domain
VKSRSVSNPLGKREEGGEADMPTYVSLFNWTDQGIRNVRDTVQRAERSQDPQDKHGVRLEQIYWTLGPYDIVPIAEAADEESITAFLLELASAGTLGPPRYAHTTARR